MARMGGPVLKRLNAADRDVESPVGVASGTVAVLRRETATEEAKL
jgi:hypothetical protein